tara:strand:- start:1431 stop:2684 length:1254 start_codon:yes stop_codon:yes gene_type:complete
MRHTKFAIDNAAVTLQGTQKTGANTVTNLPREGDLITYLYVVIDLPGLSNGVYAPRVGQALIERCQIFLGSQCIDEVTAEYLFMWDSLSGQAGKALGEMIGHDPDGIHPSGDYKDERAQRLYVPIPFWFNSACPGGVTGNALPLISLQFHAVTVKLNLRSIVGLASAESGDVTVQDYHGIDSIGMPLSDFSGGSTALSDDQTQVQLEVGYVYLDNEERSRFADSNMEVLMSQTQQMTKKRSSNATEQHRLYFNHPVSSLIWGVRQDPDHLFDFSGRQLDTSAKEANAQGQQVASGTHSADPICSAQLKFNNHSRFNMAGGCNNSGGVPASYFRTVTPYQSHSRIPDASQDEFVYTYPFALQPESAQPSGTVNFSRIDNAILELCYDNDGEEHETHVFAKNWNILRIASGMGGLAFSN